MHQYATRSRAIRPVPPPSGLRCVLVGYGSVAAIHLRKAIAAGVRVLAVVDPDPVRRAQARADGLAAHAALAHVAALRPDYWDVCTPSATHLETLAAILAIDPRARVLMEKPLCGPAEIAAAHRLLGGARVVVNENYAGSAVTARVRAALAELDLAPHRVVVEMSKNRLPDVVAGRFLDTSLGALGYEGSHLLAILADLGREYWPERLEGVTLEDATLPNGRRLIAQGGAAVRARGHDGLQIVLHTALAGGLGHPYAPFAPPAIGPGDAATRYRVVAVEGHDRRGRPRTVAGFFEPIRGQSRCQGALAVLGEGRVLATEGPIADDGMARHLERALAYFAEDGENPYPPAQALRAVERLAAMVDRAMPDEGERVA